MNDEKKFLPYEKLKHFFAILKESGFQIVGPTVIDEAIVYEEINEPEELPWHYVTKQGPGEYQIIKTKTKKAFNFVNTAMAIKPFTFASREILWQADKSNDKLSFTSQQEISPNIAFIGARPCDLQALRIQDKVFMGQNYCDNRYQQKRQKLFIIAINCSQSSNNCFCVAMGQSPESKDKFDIALTEINQGFVCIAANEPAKAILTRLDLALASEDELQQEKDNIHHAAKTQNKTLPNNTPQKLMANLKHKAWQDVAEKCLSCGNCTQVCPTCFCHLEKQENSFNPTKSTHVRLWDSCFNDEHSYIHGKTIRSTISHRYRQWLTHKFATWHEQFGESGCVGCGRCISWCPVGIDVTEQIKAVCYDDD